LSEWIDATRVGLCLFALCVAAYTDIKTREVPNELWYGLGAAGLVAMGLGFSESFGGLSWLLAVPVALVFVVVVTGLEIIPVFPKDAKVDENTKLTARQEFLTKLDLGLSAAMLLAALAFFVFAGGLDLGRATFVLAGPQAQAYSVSLMCLFALGMFYVSLISGGADMKALATLALLFPAVPSFPGLPLVHPNPTALLVVPFALAVYFNGALVLVVAKFPVYPVLSARRGHLRFPESVAGYPKPPSEVNLEREWINAKLVDGQVKQTLWPKHGAHSDEKQKELLEFLKARNEPFVFVSQRLPFMVYLAAGFVAALVVSSPLYFVAG
jgi:hypothetical protein